MKKELAAAALLLLLAAAAIWNVHYLAARCDSIDSAVAHAQSQYLSGDGSAAAQALTDARSDWDSMDRYAHIMLPHSAVESVTETFDAAKAALSAGDPAAEAQLLLLRTRIANLGESERAALGNVF